MRSDREDIHDGQEHETLHSRAGYRSARPIPFITQIPLATHGRSIQQVPQGPYYWARVPLEAGHAFTLTGWEPLPSGRGTEIWIAALLDAGPAAELVIYADPARGTFRYASIVGSRFEASLFLARDKSALPSRDAIAPLLGTRIETQMRTRVLAGRALSDGAAKGTRRTICACFAVGLETLHHAISSR